MGPQDCLLLYLCAFIVFVLHEPDYNSRQIRALFTNDTERNASVLGGRFSRVLEELRLGSLRSKGSQYMIS